MNTRKQIRQRGFAKILRQRLAEDHPELAEKFSNEELTKLFETSLKVLAELLRDGYRVIFEGYFSYFTKPIKRKCTNLHTNETWWTHKRRIRVKPMEQLKSIAEVDISEEDYENYIDKTQKKKNPAGV